MHLENVLDDALHLEAHLARFVLFGSPSPACTDVPIAYTASELSILEERPMSKKPGNEVAGSKPKPQGETSPKPPARKPEPRPQTKGVPKAPPHGRTLSPRKAPAPRR